MNIYVFDIDKTLAKDQTIVLCESPEFADVYEWERIKRTMRNPSNGFYFDQFTSILSAPNCKG